MKPLLNGHLLGMNDHEGTRRVRDLHTPQPKSFWGMQISCVSLCAAAGAVEAFESRAPSNYKILELHANCAIGRPAGSDSVKLVEAVRPVCAETILLPHLRPREGR